MLDIRNFKVNIGSKEVIKGLNLMVPPGEIHVLMGPNGVGKSTLGHVLMGSPQYQVIQGQAFLDGVDLLALETTQRAKQGLFLAFQYPVSIAGLRLSEFLRNLYNVRHDQQLSVSEFRKKLKDKLEILDIERGVLQRYLNDGFSGGEMKRFEMLQLMLFEPKIAILDEIDSGVDVDAQKIIAQSIRAVAHNQKTGFLIVTHYNRLLNLLEPHKIHVMLEGRVVRSGDMGLVENIERNGYDSLRSHFLQGANP